MKVGKPFFQQNIISVAGTGAAVDTIRNGQFILPGDCLLNSVELRLLPQSTDALSGVSITTFECMIAVKRKLPALDFTLCFPDDSHLFIAGISSGSSYLFDLPQTILDMETVALAHNYYGFSAYHNIPLNDVVFIQTTVRGELVTLTTDEKLALQSLYI